MHPGQLTDLASEVLKLIGSLAPIPPVDDVGLRQRFLDLLGEFHARAVRAGYANDLIATARLALMALSDERVMALDAAIATSWKNAPLLQPVSGDQDNGRGFQERLHALRPPATIAHADALEVVHLCLCFGLRGHFTIDEEAARQRLIADLAREIRAARATNHDPRPLVGDVLVANWVIPAPGRWRGLTVWAIPLMLAVVGLLWWLLMSSWTAAAIARLANDFPVP